MMTQSRRFLALMAVGVMLTACTATRPPSYNLPSADSLVPGEEITVKRSDNLYTLAQEHGAKIREIIALNDLKPPYVLRSGQTLVMPAKDRYFAPTPKPAPLDPIDKGYMGPASPRIGGALGLGGVTSAPLEPAATGGAAPSSYSAQPLGQPAALPPVKAQPNVQMTKQPFGQPTTPLDASPANLAPSAAATPAPATIAAAATAPVPKATEKALEKAAASTGAQPSFGWPVRGTIISAFGPKGQGLDNDGINIAAPKGAPVSASDAGIVVYAGSEMKGFGNLVLVRHEGGWVTAYAHLERIVVARDSVVAKGDVIGYIGTTGGVSSPQLHFEARQEGRPVDPELVIK